MGVLTPVHAGGPVIVEAEPEVVEAEPASSTGMLIPLLLLAVAIAVASGGGDDDSSSSVSQVESDIRLKEDIQRVGTNRLGLGVYRYRYKGMVGVWEGVMAQDVEIMHPAAVTTRSHGFKAVDYGKLGLTHKRVA